MHLHITHRNRKVVSGHGGQEQPEVGVNVGATAAQRTLRLRGRLHRHRHTPRLLATSCRAHLGQDGPTEVPHPAQAEMGPASLLVLPIAANLGCSSADRSGTT